MKTETVLENGFKETEIGLIPEDWETTTLENEKLFEFTNGLWKGKKAPFVTAKVIRNTNFNNDGTLFLDDVAELDVEEKQFIKRQLSEGDIILERSGGGPKQPVGRVVFFDLKKVNYSFSNFTTRIRVKDINKIQPKYILYYLLHFYNRGCTYELQQRTTGIRNLNFKDYKKIQVPLLSLTAQRKIAFVLSKIQQAIEQQDRIIEITRELKKSLMNKLFTEGLHGEKQKETEIGLMPKSWRIVKLGDNDIVEVIMGQSPPSSTYNTMKEGLPFFQGKAEFGDIYPKARKYCSKPNRIANEGDILLSVRAPVGDVNLLPFICCIGRGLAAIRCKDKLNNYFLFNYLLQSKSKIASLGDGSTFKAIGKTVVKNIRLPLPERKEQDEITNIFSNTDKKLSQAEYKKQTLQALFRSMLNQLMTGKVRVKDFDFEVD